MSNAKKPKALKDRLAAAKPAERSVEVCLRGDLRAEHDALTRELKRIRAGAVQSLAGQADEAKVAQTIQALEAQMADEMLTVTVRALSRMDWRKLVEQHPPRQGNDGDRVLGADFAALMDEATPRCVVDPEMDAEDWERLNEVLASGDWDRIYTAVWEVNREGGDVPKSLLASRVMAERGDGQK